MTRDSGVSMKESHRAYCILVVEDNARDAELIRESIASVSRDLHAEVVNDGEEAVRRLQERPLGRTPDLILSDVKLPRRTGFEVVRFVRSFEALRFVPVVLFSSSRQASDIREAYEAGANAYAVKPVNFDDFTERVALLVNYWLLHNETTRSSQ